jgi:hypothetical protein
MLGPDIECVLSLGHELVTLVHGGDARDCARCMIQDFIGHVRGYPEPCHSGYRRPTQIVESPAEDLGLLIEFPLRPREPAERLVLAEYVSDATSRP